MLCYVMLHPHVLIEDDYVNHMTQNSKMVSNVTYIVLEYSIECSGTFRAKKKISQQRLT